MNTYLSEPEFKSQYIAAFLGAYMANRYDSDCQNWHKDEPYNNQPIEDAMILAECAWKSYLKMQQCQ